ncbi:MAG: hypothetical protein HY741_23075 [Chloroflexi bacterium]|nr:hypothetical protein [Chloroflexota bacterium]
MNLERRIAVTSAAIYGTISIAAALLFFTAATLAGTYTNVARFGGAAWVLLLSFIVTMPFVISAVKKRMKACSSIFAQKLRRQRGVK